MRRLPVILLVALVSVGVPRPAAAWGYDVHKFIMQRAIPLLPPEIRPFFEKFQTTVVEHAIDPDTWRTVGWEAEPPRHFVDMDAYGKYPFKDLPHDYEAAAQKYGREFVDRNGTLPWRVEEMYGKLVEAFTQRGPYSRDNIKLFSSVIAHYAADAHVPLHACLNYDGQLTGQWGIHARFESELFERYQPSLHIQPRAVVPVANPREFIFESLLVSFPLVQPVLDADRAAIAGRGVYDDAYFAAFFPKVKPILEKRISDSITDVASMITAAWVQAGRPPLALDVKRGARKVRRQ